MLASYHHSADVNYHLAINWISFCRPCLYFNWQQTFIILIWISFGIYLWIGFLEFDRTWRFVEHSRELGQAERHLVRVEPALFYFLMLSSSN